MSLTDFSEPQPSLAWTFESSNVDYVTNLAPSSQVSPGPGQLQGSAALVNTAPTSNTAVYLPGVAGSYMNMGTSSAANFNLSTSNIFIEAFVYINNVNGTRYICGTNVVPATSDDWGLRVYGTALHAYTYLTSGSTSQNYSSATNILPNTGLLTSNKQIISLNGSYNMIYQTDGNFVLYSSGTPVWSFNTVGFAYGSYTVGSIYLNPDGYLEMLDAGGISRWTSNAPSGTGPYRFVLQNDRNAVIYDSTETAIWSTGTGIGGAGGQQTILTPATWYHVAVSIQTTGTISLFVNGVLQPTGRQVITGTPRFTTGKSFWIGSTTGWDPTNGYIRDLRVVQGGVVPVATFTPASAPFSYASPTYVANMGTTVFTLLGQFITYVPGKYNQAINFTNGTNGANYITTGALPVTLSNTVGFTCSFWINFNPAIGSNQYPLALYNGDTSKLVFYFVVTTGLSAFRGDSATRSGAAAANMSLVPSASTWYHMALTVTDTTWNAYINGAIRPEASGAYTSANLTNINGPLWIGASNGLTGLAGYIDDLRIYNTALTAVQVQSIYIQGGAPASNFRAMMPQPSLAWDFQSSNVDYISRTSPNYSTIDAALTSAPTYEAGKFLYGIRFTNPSTSYGNTYIRYNITSIPADTGITMCAWVKYTTLTSSTTAAATLYDGVFSSGFSNTLSIGINTTTCIGYNSGASIYSSILTPNSISGTFQAGAWYHIAIVFTSSSIIQYLNGTASTPKTTGTTGLSFNGLRLGTFTNSLNNNSGNSGINGVIDDLRIYNTALTYAQIQSIYNQKGIPGRAAMNSHPLPIIPDYTYIPVKSLPASFTLTQTSTSNAWTYGSGQITDGGTNPVLTLVADAPSDLYSAVNPGIWCRLGRQGGTNEYVRHAGFVMNLTSYTAGNFDFAWAFFLKNGTTNQVKIWNPYPGNGTGYWVQSGTYTPGRIAINTTDPLQAHIYTISSPPAPPTSMSGAPLFNQLPQSATSSAVGAFSLRAVNGVTAKAVQVRPQAQFPPVAMSSAAVQSTNQFTQALTGYPFGGTGSYTANCSSFYPSLFPWRAFDKTNLEWASGAGADYSAGVATTNTQTSGLYNGAWLQIQLPIAINLYSYSVTSPPNWSIKSPAKWYILGSNDGTTWTLVDSQQTAVTWTGVFQVKTFIPTPTIAYSYYRIVVNEINGTAPGGGLVEISEWNLYGAPPNTATDFYADERGNLLPAPVVGMTLRNWLGGATGYVTKWYDQSGRGNDASQATAANQPIIQRATKGPGYACLFNGTTNYLTGMSYTVLNGTNYSFSVVERRNASTSLSFFISSGNSGNDQGLHVGYGTNTLFRFGQWSNDLDINPYTGYVSNEPLHYWAGTQSSTSGRYLYDKTNNTVTSNVLATSSLSSTSGNFVIGARPYSTGYYSGEIYEVLVLTQSLYDLDGTTSINQIYNSQLGYTGT